MTEQSTSSDAPPLVCPWCSAGLPSPGLPRCPTCGAVLTSDVDESLPGLTAIDAAAIVRSKQTAIRPRSRLLSWLSGDDGDESFTKAEGHALEPPDLAVRREIFRLELEAEVANLQAENEAIMAEAVAEGRVVEVPPDLAADLGMPTTVDAEALADASEALMGDTPEAPEVAEAVESSPSDVPAEIATVAEAAETAPAEAKPSKSRRLGRPGRRKPD
jgi:hypothetical protein